MPEPMNISKKTKAAIITIGTELVHGFVTDLNSVFISRYLAAELGIETVKFVAVPDEEAEILRALEFVSENGLIIVTGGLGPTSDDFTREMISKFTGITLVTDERAKQIIKERYQSYGLVAEKDALRQSQKPEGARLIYPRTGTAPGIVLSFKDNSKPSKDKLLIALPGVPKEVKDMLAEVKDHLAEHIRDSGSEPVPIRVVSFMIYGMGEVQVEDKLRHLLTVPDGLRYNILGSINGITINLILTDPSSAAAAESLDKLAGAIESEFKESIITRDTEQPEEVAGVLLREAGKTLAVAESCSGGGLSDRITNISGSSGYFNGGVVSYSNEAKVNLLGVPAEMIERLGAVSEEVARAMAAGARERFGADIGIGITGVAGPTGGSDEKPVGLVYIALEAGDKTSGDKDFGDKASGVVVFCAKKNFSGDRETVKRRSSQYALSLLLSYLKGQELR